MTHNDIRIGTLVKGNEEPAEYIKHILPHGFESFSITFWQTLGGCDLKRLAEDCQRILEGSGVVISTLGFFGNPLETDAKAAEAREGFEKLIDHAHLFGCDMVSGFTGRVVDQPIEASLPRFTEVFGALSERASNRGVRIAFENCQMGGNWQRGDWNIAHGPAAWELMFDAVPAENIGLQWEPCHQMVALIDPLPQLRKWLPKIFNVHGKDATILWDVVREQGIYGPEKFVFHRTPGFGDSNWTDIISELRRGGYQGSIDIEGWHDPVYRDELEMTGQVYALNYLKCCRGGEFIANPNPINSKNPLRNSS